MKTIIPDISKQIYKQDLLNILNDRYSSIGPLWISHQLEWTNEYYRSFKNHDKFLIVIYLVKKTLDFYSRNFTKLSYEDFYSKDTIEIEKFKISEISINLDIPKESARRKILELEKSLVIKKIKKKIIIDRSAYPRINPINSILRISRFLSTLSNFLLEQKVLQKKFTSEELEKIIKSNFSYFWKLYYEFQIPMLLGYKYICGDIESFHIFGTCAVNEHLHSQKKNNKMTRSAFIKSFYSNKIQGVNAMSISDITSIPRATVIRKLKRMIKLKMLSIDEKKHYTMNESFVKKLIPLQSATLNRLADFSTQIFNLALINPSMGKKSNKEFEVPFI